MENASKKRHAETVRARARAYYHSGRGKAILRMREAAKRGATATERIYISDVAAEQCGLCYLCSEPMDKPTLDHIVPLARGGAHVRANVAAAHKVCNSRKNTKPLILAMLALRKTG